MKKFTTVMAGLLLAVSSFAHANINLTCHKIMEPSVKFSVSVLVNGKNQMTGIKMNGVEFTKEVTVTHSLDGNGQRFDSMSADSDSQSVMVQHDSFSWSISLMDVDTRGNYLGNVFRLGETVCEERK